MRGVEFRSIVVEGPLPELGKDHLELRDAVELSTKLTCARVGLTHLRRGPSAGLKQCPGTRQLEPELQRVALPILGKSRQKVQRPREMADRFGHRRPSDCQFSGFLSVGD